jgi:hypothetical protein
MTTHACIMRDRTGPDRDDPNPACTAELVEATRGFWDDAAWTVYGCPSCRVWIAAVEGRAHRRNHVTGAWTSACPTCVGAGKVAIDERCDHPAEHREGGNCARCRDTGLVHAVCPDCGGAGIEPRSPPT